MTTRPRARAKTASRRRIEPRKSPRQQRAAVTVDAILVAAGRVLVADGYARLNTNRVAEVAGVSIGSLYQYFPSKEALFAALLRRHDDQMRARFDASAQAAVGLPLREAVAALVHGFIDGHRADAALQSALASVPHLEGASARSRNLAEAVDQIARLLALKLPGQPRARLDLFAFTAVHLVEGVGHEALSQRPADVASGALAEVLIQTLCSALAALEQQSTPPRQG